MNSPSLGPAPSLYQPQPQPQPALPSSMSADPSSPESASQGSLRGSLQGSLCAEVLSAYDLPFSEPPLCCTLTVSSPAPAVTLKTSPPLARHKNRNSFRFGPISASSPSSSVPPPGGSKISSVMEMVAPLRELCTSKATVRVVYANKPPLEATYDLSQLRIHESKWLILNLDLAGGGTLAPLPNMNINQMEEEIPPTIRVKFTLSGPYRPEIAALVTVAQAWFGLIDGLEHKAQQLWQGQGAPKLPFDLAKIAVLPVPIVAIVVVASPVIAAVVMISLPFLLPVVLLVITTALAAGLLAASLFFSTRLGRDYLGAAVTPILDSFLLSKAGQTTVYDVGPRPTPVSVAKQILPTGIWGKLIISLLIDLIGSSSYLLPVVGEGLDIAWAPIQTILVMAMYNNVTPNLKYVSFFEEILPFTDIVPTASIGFLCEFVPQLMGEKLEFAPTGASHPNRIVQKLE